MGEHGVVGSAHPTSGGRDRRYAIGIVSAPVVIVAVWLMMGHDWMNGKKTIDDRVAEFGAAVRERLRPEFERAGIAYPPKRAVLVGLKQERRLEVWAAGDSTGWRLLKSYPILAASGTLGPKLREGDRQVPEGLYRVESLNPNSSFHLALRLNYPNEFDRSMAAAEGRDQPGSDIMIHGSDRSIGCLALGDEAAEDLFILSADIGIENVSVVLSPVDFRKGGLPSDMPPVPAWMGGVYEQIRAELGKLGSRE